MMDYELDKALKFDAISVAESVIGEGFEETTSLAFSLMHQNADYKEKLLAQRGDVYYGMKTTDYLKAVDNMGFEVVLEIPFFSKKWNREDVQYILWHAKYNILLNFDTFGSSVNGGNMYYNVKPLHGDLYKCMSSGHINNTVLVGHHDCREAVGYTIERFLEEGEFLNPWIERPFMWLINYNDNGKSEKYESLNSSRIAMLPKYIQRSITPEGNK